MSDPVHEWIEKSFEMTDDLTHIPLFMNRYIPFLFNKNGDAWDYLRRYRELCDPTDPDLACAEHYMFARYMSSLSPVFALAIRVLIGQYQLAKVEKMFLDQIGITSNMHYGSHQPTRPSARQVYWAYRGLARGLYEYLDSAPSQVFAREFGTKLGQMAGSALVQ